MKKSIRLSRLLAATTLSLSVVSAFAAPQKDLAPAEAAYQAGSSPLGSVDMCQDINPKARPRGCRTGARRVSSPTPRST